MLILLNKIFVEQIKFVSNVCDRLANCDNFTRKIILNVGPTIVMLF